MNNFTWPLAATTCVYAICHLTGRSPNALVLLASFVAPSSILWLSYRASTDPYGLFHLSLNRLPGQPGNAPVKTEWLNMGFWESAVLFPQACEALALKLVHASGLKAGDRVLDVGHGTGDSLLLLLSNPSVPRPSHLTGITSHLVHHQHSQARVKIFQSTQGGQTVPFNLYAGDAVDRYNTLNHPLHRDSAMIFDTILALDCAYHFETRRIFLEQCFAKLAIGGHVALADICFDPSSSKTLRYQLITRLFKFMPKQNLITMTEYTKQMEDIGYDKVRLEDISENVFPGFVQFLKSRGTGWLIFGLILQLYVSAGARFVIVTGSRQQH